MLGAVVPVYNMPGVNKDLNFSGDVIADIYLGKITNWNDPRIAKDNPGVNLPDQRDPAGLSLGRQRNHLYLYRLPLQGQPGLGAARSGKGTSVKWPTGIGQKGNEGVAGMVRQSPYSFGYVELIYAVQNKMSFGAVKNAAGKFVKAAPTVSRLRLPLRPRPCRPTIVSRSRTPPARTPIRSPALPGC